MIYLRGAVFGIVEIVGFQVFGGSNEEFPRGFNEYSDCNG